MGTASQSANHSRTMSDIETRDWVRVHLFKCQTATKLDSDHHRRIRGAVISCRIGWGRHPEKAGDKAGEDFFSGPNPCRMLCGKNSSGNSKTRVLSGITTASMRISSLSWRRSGTRRCCSGTPSRRGGRGRSPSYRGPQQPPPCRPPRPLRRRHPSP